MKKKPTKAEISMATMPPAAVAAASLLSTHLGGGVVEWATVLTFGAGALGAYLRRREDA